MLRFKPEVRIGYCDARVTDVLRVAALWSMFARVDVSVNSIEDGAAVHQAGSLHSVGLAVDLDVIGDQAPAREALYAWLARQLDPQYDVVHELDHVHVEWDAHRARVAKGSV